MGQLAAVFRGDAAQLYALMRAVDHHCTCNTGHCPAHGILLDQRLLDRILFARYLAERLLAEEFKR